METKEFKNRTTYILAIILGLAGLITFLIKTDIIFNPLILFIISLFLLLPNRHDSPFLKQLLLLIVLIFIGWLLTYVSSAVVIFCIAFFIAYIFDPIVSKVSGRFFPRWLASLIIVVIFIGLVSLVSVFIFPAIFSQLNEASKKIASIVTQVQTYLDTRKIYQVFDWLGIKDENLRKIIRSEFIPEIKTFLENIFGSLMNLVKGISVIASQVLNAVLIPILSFYFLKDFRKLKEQIKFLLGKKNEKLVKDLRRINDIFKVYIGWQIFAAVMVGTICSISFSLLNVSYPFLLGMICGFLNPIPYLGIISSLIITSLTIIILDPPDMLHQIIVIVTTILTLHTLNAYLIEPMVLGKRVGLHPLILFASLFVFGALFGFLGMLVAVPCSATLMLFFNDWQEKHRIAEEIARQKEAELTVEETK